MKLVMTALGAKTIDDWDANYVPVKLRDILHDHRAAIINNLLKGKGLEQYIFHKFETRFSKYKIAAIKDDLFKLKHTPLNIDNYRPVLEKVLKNENTHIENEIFFQEIEIIIKNNMPHQDGPTGETFSIGNQVFREIIRKEMVDKIQTEEGLRAYVIEHYNNQLASKSKLLYLLDEVRSHFRKEPSDYQWLHTFFDKQKLGSPQEGNEYIFDEEMNRILDKHFENLHGV